MSTEVSRGDKANYFCARLCAAGFDRAILLIGIAVTEAMFHQVSGRSLWRYPVSVVPLHESLHAPWLFFIDLSMVFFLLLPAILPALILMGYMVITKSVYGRTPGMMSWNLRIVTADGHRPGVLRLLFRHLASVVSAFTLIGYIWPLFDQQGRTFHDIIAGTLVVREGTLPGRWSIRSEGV